MSLKQDERRYAMKRVDEIKSARQEAIREKCTKQPKGLNDQEKLRAIKRGTVYLETRGWNLGTPIGDCFSFRSLEPSNEFDQKQYIKAVSKLRKEAAKVSDEIMLGDAEKAKKLLLDFEKSV